MIGLLGILFFLGVAYLLSSNRAAIRWRTVISGLLLQLIFSLLVLRLGFGKRLWAAGGEAVTQLIAAADEGGRFVFGWLAADPNPDHFVFAVRVLPILIFVSGLFSCLYYLGIMQAVVGGMARLMTRVMGVSGSESVAVAANVFVGQTEAPLIVAPYVPEMTESELMALMTAGMATVSGSVLGGYIALGIRPDHLLAASFMAAPAALVMAKIMVPETSSSKTAGLVSFKIERTSANLVDALARGASQGVRLALNIAAMLIAFVAMVYLANGVLAVASRMLGLEAALGLTPTLQLILGYLLAPLAFVMGVPWEDSLQVGQLIGVKVVLNEFVAYRDLAVMREALGPKSELIATYALCGFANFGSIGVQIGGIGGLAPERKWEVAKLGMRALLAGSMASFLTASLAAMVSPF